MSKLDDILEDLMLDVGKDGYFAWSAHRTAKKLIKQEANRKQQIKDLIINLIEQESFYDPDTKQTTFYTDDIVDRIKKL